MAVIRTCSDLRVLTGVRQFHQIPLKQTRQKASQTHTRPGSQFCVLHNSLYCDCSLLPREVKCLFLKKSEVIKSVAVAEKLCKRSCKRPVITTALENNTNFHMPAPGAFVQRGLNRSVTMKREQRPSKYTHIHTHSQKWRMQAHPLTPHTVAEKSLFQPFHSSRAQSHPTEAFFCRPCHSPPI